ncbi:F-box/kelch-repeat protein-like protein [Tanacetum coccineum]|uniref:F-box/kelch-repeat protein-like protein n=1 Tax=Tanacetum coccineum TaxID=301880 RepID=A0ABQ5IN19_9ASTR
MSSYVCEDLMANIFERLQHKSVGRLRTLSKYWCSRLASPEFVRMHTLRSLKKKTSHKKVLLRHSFKYDTDIFTSHSPHQLPLYPKRRFLLTGVELPYDTSGAEIVGSCNGILCLSNEYNGLINLWNFSVRRKLVVPTHPSIGASKEGPDHVVFGFGYDRVTHDYNIVGISYSSNGRIARNDSSFIYSMKTNSWSMIAPPTRLFTYAISNACFFDGNLHWVVGTSDSSNFIMTFSLTTRVFGTIELPKNWRCWGCGRQLTIIKGRLAVIGRCFSDTTIWVMEKYGKGLPHFTSLDYDDDDDNDDDDDDDEAD